MHSIIANNHPPAFQSYIPPASAKMPDLASTMNHSRHNFSKRSFGRDLLNLQSQQNVEGISSSGLPSAKASHLFNVQKQVNILIIQICLDTNQNPRLPQCQQWADTNAESVDKLYESRKRSSSSTSDLGPSDIVDRFALQAQKLCRAQIFISVQLSSVPRPSKQGSTATVDDTQPHVTEPNCVSVDHIVTTDSQTSRDIAREKRSGLAQPRAFSGSYQQHHEGEQQSDPKPVRSTWDPILTNNDPSAAFASPTDH